MTQTSDDATVDVLGEARQLLDAWCDRRAYDAICTMYAGLRSVNGLTDGWDEFIKALKQLRILAKNENGKITEVEARKVSLLIGVVSRSLNPR